MPNRALQVKADRATSQRVNAGMIEGTKHAYRSKHSKSVLRELAASAQHMVRKFVPVDPLAAIREEVTYVDYRRAVTRKGKTAFAAACVDFAPVLIKR